MLVNLKKKYAEKFNEKYYVINWARCKTYFMCIKYQFMFNVFSGGHIYTIICRMIILLK